MDAMEFVANYESMLNSFRPHVSEEMDAVIAGMLEIDPHDLISPFAYFVSYRSAIGFLWTIMVGRYKAERSRNATRTAT